MGSRVSPAKAESVGCALQYSLKPVKPGAYKLMLQGKRIDVPVLIRGASGFGVVSLAFAAAGILTMLGVLHGGLMLGIFLLVVALAPLGIAAYFVWAHFYIKKHPDAAKNSKRPLDGGLL